MDAAGGPDQPAKPECGFGQPAPPGCGTVPRDRGWGEGGLNASGQDRLTQIGVLSESLIERHDLKVSGLGECRQVGVAPNVS